MLPEGDAGEDGPYGGTPVGKSWAGAGQPDILDESGNLLPPQAGAKAELYGLENEAWPAGHTDGSAELITLDKIGLGDGTDYLFS